MGSEVADLYVVLRAETAPFLAGMRRASTEGESFTAKMGGPVGVLSKIGAAATAAGAVLAVASIKMAGDFQFGMQKLVSTAGEAPDKLKLVSDGILKLAVDTGTSTKQLSDGMYMVESATFHGTQGLQVLKAAAQGARQEQAPLAEVANAVTSALKSYHLGADQATTVTNQMVAAVGHGKMTFSDFSGSLSTVLPIASSAKLSFAEVGGAIATLTNHGTSANEATQELANTIRNLQAPNNVAVQEMQRLGLSSVDVSTNLGNRGLTGTIQLLSQTVLQHMGPAGTVLLDTFNSSKQAAASADKMIQAMPKSLQDLAKQYQAGSISVADWRAALKTLPVDQANLASQFATLENKSKGFNSQLKAGGPDVQTYNDAMKKMMGGATGLNTALMLGGENMVDFTANVAAVAEAGKNAGTDIKGWDDTQKTFNFQISQLKERVEVAAITIGTKLIPIVLSAIGWFSQHKTVTEYLAVAIGVVLTGSVLTFVGKALMPFIGGLKAIGVGAAGAYKAVAGVDWASVGQSFDGIRLRGMYAWESIKGGASTVGGVLRTAGSAALDLGVRLGSVVKAGGAAAWSVMVSGLQTVGTAAKSAVVGLAEMTQATVAAGVAAARTAAAWIVEKVAVLASAVAEGLMTAAQWLLNVALDANPIGLVIIAITALVAAIVYAYTHFTWFRNVVQGTFQLISVVALWLWHDVFQPAFHGIAAAAVWLWKDVIVPAWNGITGTISSAVGWIGGLPGMIGGFFSDAGSWLWTAGQKIVSGLIGGIKSMIGSVGGAIGSVASTIRSYLPFSPAKQGPLSGSGSPDIAGARIGSMLADGIHSSVGGVSRASGRLAGAVALSAAGVLTAGGGGLPGLAVSAASGGQTVVVNVNVQGSIHSERDLREVIERQMYQLGMRNSTTWQNYTRR